MATPNMFWPNTAWPANGATSQFGTYRLWSTAPSTNHDYTRYVYESPVKMDRINEPDFLDFALVPFDAAFVKLVRGNYVQFDTVSLNTWFTGFVTNDPELEQLGVQNNQPLFGYRYEIASEDYLLNLKPIGILPPFLNTTQGQILQQLIQLLAPEYNFNVNGIQPGLSIARYIADPQKKFTDIVKEFAEAAYYRWSCRNGSLYFEPQDTRPANIVIDGSVKDFTPANLKIQPSQDPILNDAIVLGDTEPQNYMIEYFVGNGFEKKFSLVSSVYGVDSSVLLDDDFGNSEIDSSKWDVFDDPQNYIQLFNGYVNCLGGRNDGSLGIYLESANLIPLEGNMKITHGEWDFVQASDGVICSLWTDVPQTDLSDCIYGIRVSKSGANTVLQPIINGSVDPSQSYTISTYNYRYVLRTVFSFQQQHRLTQSYASMNSAGTIQHNGGTSVADVMTASTWITVIDPNTSNIITSVQWYNTGAVLPATANFAYYDPAVMNDLHATFTGITVSTPLQASLFIQPKGSGAWQGQLIGPNEMDSFDGLTPSATIVDANQGATTKSSKLGRSQYNPGNAALEYFSDPTKQADQQYAPPESAWIKLTYRRAGAAMARVQDRASIQTEAAAWGDSGIRSITRQDLQPSPRNAAECEYAAWAIVSDFSRQHWDGNYTQHSLYEFTGEPLSGTVLKFQNLPSQYPSSLTAETIQEVKTTFVSASPQECFQHEIKFGRKDSSKKALASFTKKADVFQPQDTAEIPDSLNIDAVGTAFTVDVPNVEFVNYDRSNLYFQTNQLPPAGGAFEVRYTDESWGCDDAKNLVTRTGGLTATFSIPRTLRGRVVFVRAYDVRNQALWSEDLTTDVWGLGTGTTVTNATETNPDDARASISTVTFGTDASVSQTLGAIRQATPVVFCTSVKAADPTHVGQTVTLQILSSAGAVLASQAVSLSRVWQRYCVAYSDVVNDATAYTIRLSSTSGVIAKVTRVQFESSLNETVYCKTKSTPYGALSRWATGIHVATPLIPPAPTASIDTSKITAPIVNIALPAAQQDVWGIAIRASDNKTTVYAASLESPNITLSPQLPGNTQRNLTYYVYTYNILGEYSDPYVLHQTIPTPFINSLYVDDSARTVHWMGYGSNSFLVEIDATNISMSHVYWQNMQSANSLWLNDTEFFPQRWISITPFDDIGAGTPAVVSHLYSPVQVTTWNPTVITNVPAPPTPAADVTPPTSALLWRREYIRDSWDNYSRNRFRYE